ncbi:MAG: orotate phosphoribosyltransferase [Phycisphaerales bacterium]|nr:orotate phosphoribosyltransferase [Phycisphaerales bacterium]
MSNLLSAKDFGFSNDIAQILLSTDAIRLNFDEPFVWTSGWYAPIYCDNRRLLSYPKERDIIISSLVFLAQQSFKEFDVIAGVATAGIPWGALVADRLEKPFIYIRSTPKGHGLQNLIEGYYLANQKILVVEDLISTAKSSLAAIAGAIQNNLQPIGVLSIFNYGFIQAQMKLDAEHIPVASLLTFHALLSLAVEQKIVPAASLTQIKEWQDNPEKWRQSSL